MQCRYMIAVGAMSLVVFGLGCGNATDHAASGRLLTRQQELSSSYEWSHAPAASGGFGASWQAAATVVGPNGETYLAGNLNEDSSVDFGCRNPLSNPAGSRSDSFLVKFDSSGNCKWQESFGSGATTVGNRIASYAVDLAVISVPAFPDDPNARVLLASEQVYDGSYFGGSQPATGSVVRELLDDEANTPNPSLVWSDTLGGVPGYHKAITAIGVDGAGNLVATGTHDTDFQFAGTTTPDPEANGDGIEAFVLSWGPLTNGTRTENWWKSFGGTDSTCASCFIIGDSPVDVAVHKSDGKIAVVGNYDGEHQSIDGTTAPTGTNSSIFVQTISQTGQTTDSITSAGSPSNPDDTEYATSVAFSPSGELYVAGGFHGELMAQTGLAPALFYQSKSTASATDDDWFIVSYTDALDLSNSVDVWEHSDLSSSANNDEVETEIIRDITATDQALAIVGDACDSTTECGDIGFAHVFSSSNVASGVPFSNYLLTYPKEAYSASSVDLYLRDSAYHLNVAGGPTHGTNVDFGGGPKPGGDDFVASYVVGQ